MDVFKTTFQFFKLAHLWWDISQVAVLAFAWQTGKLEFGSCWVVEPALDPGLPNPILEPTLSPASVAWRKALIRGLAVCADVHPPPIPAFFQSPWTWSMCISRTNKAREMPLWFHTSSF